MDDFIDLLKAAERASSYEEAQHILALMERRKLAFELAEDALELKHR